MRTIAIAILSGCLAACSSAAPAASSGTDASSPLQVVTSDSGGLQIEVRTSDGAPPARGTNTFVLTIVDVATHQPIPALQVTVVPWMPAMGHGSSVLPTVLERGGGSYEIDGVALFMPGDWELRTTIAGPRSDGATPRFHID